MSAIRSRADGLPASRRDFMKVVASYLLGAAGVLGFAGVARFLSFDMSTTRKTEFDLGPETNFAVGSRTEISDPPAMVIRTQAGFLVISRVCTHLGCTVEQAPEGFACPCHGSQYGPDGAVLRGPAARPLPQLRTEISSEGRLILHLD
jgi:cytochrome b6-f complex iron-sulfur subunit